MGREEPLKFWQLVGMFASGTLLGALVGVLIGGCR